MDHTQPYTSVDVIITHEKKKEFNFKIKICYSKYFVNSEIQASHDEKKKRQNDH